MSIQNFGVPTGDGRGPLLAPKLKYKFRVKLIGFGPIATPLDVSAQVESVTKPTISHDEVTIHSYNSIAYMAGKSSFSTIDLVLRDDITNSVSAVVGHQEQKQMNHFQQTSPAAGSNYKFDMIVEALDGGNDGVLEAWDYCGCWMTTVTYGDLAYSSTSDYSSITIQVRFDNATQRDGLMPIVPEIRSGVLI